MEQTTNPGKKTGLFGSLIKNVFGANTMLSRKSSIPKLVIGINQVDNLATKDAPWIPEINLPSPELEKIIEARIEDIKSKLSAGAHSASRDQIEYFLPSEHIDYLR